MTQTKAKIEDFVFQKGNSLRLKHCGERGLFVVFDNRQKNGTTMIMSQKDVVRLKRWLDNNFGDFFD